MPNEPEEVTSQNDAEVVEVEEVTETETPENSIEDLRKQIESLQKQKEHWRKKAEEPKEVLEVKPTTDLSAVDILAVSKAGIEPEDLEDVMEYANFKKISLHEALKSSVVKATLAEKQELRKSADATNTSSARRGAASISDERLLSDAAKGNLPDSDEDLKRLIALQRKARRG